MSRAYRFILLVFLLVVLQAIHANRPIQRTRLSSTYTERYSHLLYYQTGDYHYSSSDFDMLDSIAYHIWGWDMYEDTYSTIYCQTEISHLNGHKIIDTGYFHEGVTSPFRRIYTELDSLARKILFEKYNESNIRDYREETFFDSSSRIESIIIDHEKWSYQYDSIGRKSRIDYYTWSDNWIYRGYYHLNYSEPFPYNLDFSFPYYSGFNDMRTLFDPGWKFESIVFNPVDAEPDTLAWQVVSMNPVKFQHTTYYDSVYPMSIRRHRFGSNGLLSEDYIMFDYATETKEYEWEVVTENDDDTMPDISFQLMQNYPNPFSERTDIRYSLVKSGTVSLNIYNIKGQLVKTLINEYKEPGEHTVQWTCLDGSSKTLPSGIYFARLQSGNTIKTSKLVYLK